MRDYTKIRAWQSADELAVQLYKATAQFPREELYGLTSQLRRAVCSVPANICEGSARETLKDYLHFLYIARASLSETQYFLHLSLRLGYLGDVDHESLGKLVTSTFECLHGLIRAVENESAASARP